MGERKVLNKYFPPDFDPSKMPRMKKVRSEDKQMKVRMMLPMTVRCNVCGTFMYKGTKFNTRMEDVRGETYLGIKIFRFYYRCTHCSAEFCMKTDPKNADYELEAGATRNYEPWRDKEKEKAAAVASREEEERGNAMKALENRTLDSRREMDILSALDEMRSLKARHERVDTEAALAALKRSAVQEEVDLEAEDEEAVRQMLLQRAGFVRRLSDSEGEEEGEGGGASGKQRQQQSGAGSAIAAAAGGGGGSSSRAGGKVRGAAVPSMAAALWEEELSGDASAGSEDTGIDGDAFMLQQFAAARAAAAEAEHEDGGGSSRDRGGGGSSAAAAAAGGDGTQGQQRQQQQAAGGGAQPPAAASKPAEKAPPVLPKFGIRPAAIVVKRKADADAAGAKPAKQQQQQAPAAAAAAEEGSEGSGGGGALLGLAGYGSSSGADSP